MSSCLRKGSRPSAVICPDGSMWEQHFTPKWCALGTLGLKYTCNYFACSKCHRAYKTCQELKRHQAKHNNDPNKERPCRFSGAFC